MAYAFLKGFDAPSEVSRAVLDASATKVTTVSGCRITDFQTLENGCEFERLDEGLPFNNGLFYALNFAYVPVPRELNGYWLTVTGLPDGSYEIHVGGRRIAQRTARQLAAGVDLASATTDAWQPGGPWDAQATLLRSLTEARHELDTTRLLSRLYLPGQPLTGELARDTVLAEDKLIELQRLTARPRPYRFVIRRTPAPPQGDASK